ncbi:MAG TPA: TIM-barrel domain-containing protein [bacterium]|nr:TIM-barrel domain-containing protein [bacterium]
MRYDPFRAFRRLESLRLEATTRHAARFATDAGPLEVASYAPGILRLRWGSGSGPDYGLLAAAPTPVDLECRETGDGCRVAAGDVVLELRPAPLRVRLLRENRVVLEAADDGHIHGGLRLPAFGVCETARPPASVAAFALGSGEAVYGLGEKYGPLNRRGQRVVSWNEDAWGVNAEASYKNVPFAWSPAGWGVFINTPARVVHGVGYPEWSHRAYVVLVEEPGLDLFLLTAETPAGLLDRFTHVTGRAPVPPRWSLGVWMSRAFYRTADEALDAARTLRQRRIPCDVLVLDGRAWLKVETRFAFEWDPDRYPDPGGFIRNVKALGFRLCLWEYPYVSIHNPRFAELAQRGYFLRDAQGAPYVYAWDDEPFGSLLTPLPPSGLVDFTNPDAYAWYRDAHRPLFEAGVDVMKTDFGEQIPEDARAHNGERGSRLHNVYPVLYNRCVYESTARYATGGAIVWGRSGWTGSQRYPVQWGGDPQADWEGLAASIRGGLSWGMSGAPYYSHDIGGFFGPSPAPELYVRWVQAGVMCSHTRFHGTTPREPWHFGEEAERIVRGWLEWRYRLLPYLESCAIAASTTGLPVMRAMPLAFPDDRPAAAFDEQYMLGPSLLVAPVVRPGGQARIYLPAGTWFDLSDAPRFDAARGRRTLRGPATIEQRVPLDRMPLYGRDGCLLPLGPAAQHAGELEAGAELSELVVFGLPRVELALSGSAFELTVRGDGCRIHPLANRVRVSPLGDVRVERRDGGVDCLTVE